MSKRQVQQQLDCNDQTSDKRLRPATKRKHLYLVLDDWAKGFTIHKIDTLELQGSPAAARLPEPAALRLAAPNSSGRMIFTALGGNIFIVTHQRCPHTNTLVYDTDTAGLAMGPRLPSPLLRGHVDVFVDIAGDAAAGHGNSNMRQLFVLSSHYRECQQQHSLEVLSWEPTAKFSPRMEWSWGSVAPSPPPFNTHETITSYAVHPDGRTIFVSVRDYTIATVRQRKGVDKQQQAPQGSTYSLDTKHGEWKWQGGWVLPFQGQGYYDSELDAWVGLRSDGYVCSCQVPSRSSSSSTTAAMQPEWKMAREKLFHKEPPERRLPPSVEATLTYMGNSRFCIVECVLRKEVDMEEYDFSDVDNCQLHLTMFGLKYNHKGELQTMMSRTTNSYVVSKRLRSFSPVAFWI